MSGIYDITPFSLLDFPDVPSAIIWFSGCNLRCLYCYNPDIVRGDGRINEEQILAILKKRIGFLEGVVLSGGEATLYPRLIELASMIKSMGYKLKLDTNAMRPEVLQKLLDHQLLDYAALDYKAPDSKMDTLCGGGSEKRFWESFRLMQHSNIPFEVRTTLHSDWLDEEDIITMSKQLRSCGYSNNYYLQLFRPNLPTLGEIANPYHPINIARLSHYAIIRT